jgi:hypothetical protein
MTELEKSIKLRGRGICKVSAENFVCIPFECQSTHIESLQTNNGNPQTVFYHHLHHDLQ